MATSAIATISAREIIDSRGHPTVEAEVVLNDGSRGRAAVPSGASTGAYEAVELRDGGKQHCGRGVATAVENIRGPILDALLGLDATDQCRIDQVLIDLDGSANKSRLGANAILGVSLACAKAAARHAGLPLSRYIGGVSARSLPIPMMNIINGGRHADNEIDIQEFMIMPVKAGSMSDAIRAGAEIFQTLKSELTRAGLSTAVGDEGGFAPAIGSTHQALDFITRACVRSGYQPGDDILFALDCAATEYFDDGIYRFSGEDTDRDGDENIAYLVDLVDNFPIISIEDGCAEDDWDGWRSLTEALGDRCQLVGDDLFTTNPARLSRGILERCANSLLVKVNQIGTLTETLDAVEMAHRAGYSTIMSHRSGETEDTTIADLAVALNCGQIKTGSISRSDRTAKYNQLLRIEEQLASTALYGDCQFNAGSRFQAISSNHAASAA